MSLSPHFALSEFTRSTTADRLGIDNTIPAALVPTSAPSVSTYWNLFAHMSVMPSPSAAATAVPSSTEPLVVSPTPSTSKARPPTSTSHQ